jgi:cytochrome c553
MKSVLIVVTTLALATGMVHAAQNSTAVDLVTRECSTCHGPRGISEASNFPNLAGQQPAYLQAQLSAFRDRSRADPHAQAFMWGMAAQLTDETTAGIAAYYAAQPVAPGKSTGAAEVAAGKKIYEDGVPAQHVASCQGCHGKNAEGNASFPRLTGQHRDYLERQMEAFATNLRVNESMHDTSKNLSALQISQAAAFLSAK